MTIEKLRLEEWMCEVLGLPAQSVRAVGLSLDAREDAEVTVVLVGEVVDRLIAALAKSIPDG